MSIYEKKEAFDVVDFTNGNPFYDAYQRNCHFCKRNTFIKMDKDGFTRYNSGEYAKDVWPNVELSIIEMLISGTHPECWELMFGNHEDIEYPEEEAK